MTTKQELDKILKKYNWNSVQDWNVLARDNKLSEDLIREYKGYISWITIISFQKLSEPFIKEFKDYVSWKYVCEYQTLSENFMREMKDYVWGDQISRYQNLSYEFIKEFYLQLDMNVLIQRGVITHQQKRNIQKVTRFELIDI
jgi:hypothetical protein